MDELAEVVDEDVFEREVNTVEFEGRRGGCVGRKFDGEEEGDVGGSDPGEGECLKGREGEERGGCRMTAVRVFALGPVS